MLLLHNTKNSMIKQTSYAGTNKLKPGLLASLAIVLTLFAKCQELRPGDRYLGTTRIHYVTAGSGSPIVFLHGNPTSSYIWRKIIPVVSTVGECFAPDLPGMGQSSPLPNEITEEIFYQYQYRIVDSLLQKIVQKGKVILVGHDWGAVLAIHWARLHPEKVRGIAFMETFLEPLRDGYTPNFAIEWFKKFQRPEMERAILDSNFFLEKILLGELSTFLSYEDLVAYKKPFTSPGESRLPTLLWPRQVPINGHPSHTHEVFTKNIAFMESTPLPKLFISANPGALLAAKAQKTIICNWPNLKDAEVSGRHFIQETSPENISKAIIEWIKNLK